MDCRHCFHWDKASETFNTEIESCCDCGYVKFPRLNNAELAINNVRQILKEVTVDKAETGLSRSEHLVVVALADRIYQALDGEQ